MIRQGITKGHTDDFWVFEAFSSPSSSPNRSQFLVWKQPSKTMVLQDLLLNCGWRGKSLKLQNNQSYITHTHWKLSGYFPGSLQIKLLTLWSKIDSFYWQKCTYEKVPKNWTATPPPHLDKIQKNSSFFSQAPSLWPSNLSPLPIECLFTMQGGRAREKLEINRCAMLGKYGSGNASKER